MSEIAIFAIIWIACSIYAYGLVFGMLRTRYPREEYYQSDQLVAFMTSVFGPGAVVAYVLIAVFFRFPWYGLKFK